MAYQVPTWPLVLNQDNPDFEKLKKLLMPARAPSTLPQIDYLDKSLPFRSSMIGASDTNSNEAAAGNKAIEYSPDVRDPRQMEEALSRVLLHPDTQEQGAGIQALQEQLNQFRTLPVRPDIAPISEMFDAIAGRQPLKTYKPGMSPEARIQTEIKLQDLIQKEKNTQTLARLRDLALQVKPAQPVAVTTENNKVADVKKAEEQLKSATPPPAKGAGKPIDTRELSKRLEELPKASNIIKELEPYLAKTDIPGIGPIDRLKMGIFGDKEGARVRQLATDLMAAHIKQMSGKVFSKRELENEMKARGMHWSQGEDAFINGTQDLIKEFINNAHQIESGYTPEQVSTFRKRGGMGSVEFERSMNATPVAPPGAGSGADPIKAAIAAELAKRKQAIK